MLNITKIDDAIIKVIRNHRNLKKYGGCVEYEKAFHIILDEIKLLSFLEDADADFVQQSPVSIPEPLL